MSAKEITSLLRQNNIRGYSKLKKAEKIALLIKNNIPVPEMVRAPRQQKQYGVVGGKVKPYTEKEQEQFIKAEVDVNPLIQKQLAQQQESAYKQYGPKQSAEMPPVNPMGDAGVPAQKRGGRAGCK